MALNILLWSVQAPALAFCLFCHACCFIFSIPIQSLHSVRPLARQHVHVDPTMADSPSPSARSGLMSHIDLGLHPRPQITVS